MPGNLRLYVFLPLALSGCSTAWNVATLPVKGASKAVDWTTTSQDEADRNAGRARREAQQRGYRQDEACNDCGSARQDPIYFTPNHPEPSTPDESQ